MRQLGGNWTEADLANYKVVERAPVVGHYRGARIVSGSPPTSGGIALIDALNILEGFDLAKRRQGDAHASRRRGHASRASRSRRVSRRSGFRRRPGRAADQPVLRRRPARLDPHGPRDAQRVVAGRRCAVARASTTHFSVIDKNGNMVAATITLNFFFGSGPHDSRHRHPAEQPDGRFLGRSPACRTAFSSSAPTPMRSRRRSGRCPRPRPRSSKARRAHDHRLARRQLHHRHGHPRHAQLHGRQERAGNRRARRASITSSRPTCCSSSPTR